MSHALTSVGNLPIYSTTVIRYSISPFLSNGILWTMSSFGFLSIILLDIAFSFMAEKDKCWAAESSCSGLRGLPRNWHTFCMLPLRSCGWKKKWLGESGYQHWQRGNDRESVDTSSDGDKVIRREWIPAVTEPEPLSAHQGEHFHSVWPAIFSNILHHMCMYI